MSANAPSQTVFSIGYDFHLGNGTSGADNGNVFGITNYKDQNRNQTFTYDLLNRLISAQNAGTNCAATVIGGKTEYWGNSYGYDAWGNLLQKNVTKCGAENLIVAADAHNWIHATGGADYQYDAAGNMTFNATPPTQTYTYDQENRLTGAAGYAYTYDGDGNRVIKSNGSTGTLYWYMTPGIVGESDLSGNLTDEYVFFDGERVARKSTNGVFYYFSDHLKTASVITDAAGNIKSESDFYPWGGELQFVNNDSNHYKFTGKERDTETQLDYFGARYYSNGLGRWVSADWSVTPVAVPYATLADPQTLNLYSYARSLPTTLIDDDGHGLGTPDMREVKAKQAEFQKLSNSEQNRQLLIGGCLILCSGAAAMAVPEAAPLARGLFGLALATAPVTAPIAANLIEGATPGAPSLMSTLGIGKVTGMIEDFSIGRLANGAEVAARIESSNGNTTVGILGAYNQGGAGFAGTLNSLEKGATEVAKNAGSSTVTIQAIATSTKLTKFLLKQGFTKTTVKVGEETVQAVQKTIKLTKDAN